MALIIKDRVKETTTTTGTGTITLAGASTGFRSFADIGNANTTYYCISGGSQFEVGLGTYTASGTTLSRDTVLSNSLGTTALINFSAGTKDVFCTYPSGKAILGDTSAVSSTGTGSVVLNSNPTFATDITVNGLTVGRGDGNVASNTVLGNNALNSNLVTSANANNVAIGTNALANITAGVETFGVGNAGSGYTDGVYTVQLSYVSGTPIAAGGSYPIVEIGIEDGEFAGVATITNKGSGFVDTTTVMSFVAGGGTGATVTIVSLLKSENNVAIGYNAGANTVYQANSIYIGNNAQSANNQDTQGNEIVIGSNAIGNGLNTATIGNANTNATYLKGTVNISNLTASRAVFTDASDNLISVNTTGTGSVVLATSPTITGILTSDNVRSNSTTIASASTITPASNTTNQYTVTALAVPSTIAIPSGSPIDGQKLTIRIKDDGTARALTWTTSAGGYRVIGTTLPTTTTASKVTYVGCVYNSQDFFWDVLAVATQA